MGDNIAGAESLVQKKRGWPKGKKRKKCLKDENAPKRPVTGYVLFMTERRDTIAKENPTLTFAEVTKILGEEWSSLTGEQKAVYLDIAEKRKESYLKELKSYQQSDSYKNFLKRSDRNNSQDGSSSGIRLTKTTKRSSFEDPIFTESFLDYNKTKESELHQLNRTNAEYEQHNNILENHIDNLKNAVIKLETETRVQMMKNEDLESKLQYFRELLLSSFAQIALPTTNELPSLESVDSYMLEMCNILEKNSSKDTEFISAIYEAMSAVSFQALDGYWDEHKEDTQQGSPDSVL